jgi:hypothetical protein
MRCRQPTPSSSTSNSDGSDVESYFNIEGKQETDANNEPTYVDTDGDGGGEADLAWIAREDNSCVQYNSDLTKPLCDLETFTLGFSAHLVNHGPPEVETVELYASRLANQ